TPHAVHEAIISLLIRLLYHGYVKDDYKESVKQSFASAPSFAEAALRGPYGPELAQSITANSVAGTWASIEGAAGRIRRALLIRRFINMPLTTVWSVVTNMVRLFVRMIQPTGLMVAIVGPDGSGKSAVARTSLERL